MKRKLLSIFTLVVILAIPLSLQLIPNAYADHTPKVYWTDIPGELDTKYLPAISWPIWLNFTIKNLGIPGADPIVSFKLVIPKDENGLALFHYNQSTQQLKGWSAIPDEFDKEGWPTVIIFQSNTTYPIRGGEAAWFAIQFIKGPTACQHKFAIYTTDSGSPPVTKLSWLTLIIDVNPPIILDLQPKEGETVTGNVLPCGHHYFTVYVKAEDAEQCKSGIKGGRYEIRIVDARTGKVVWGPLSGTIDKEPWERRFNVTDLPESGTYDLTVNIWDLVGNKGSKTNRFTYKIPALPSIRLTPKEGYVGTSVSVSGEYFTPGAKVKVTLIMPQGEITVANTTVKTDGTFTVSFTFPPTPRGYYEVKVYSHPCNKSAIFELKPQIIFKPNEVIGPALINVEATGFVKPDVVPKTQTIYILCNNKDSLQGVNKQVFENWYIDEQGTLQNIITHLTKRFTECGLFWPALQEGVYNVTLFLATSGSYWNVSHWMKVSTFEHTSTVKVISTLDLLPQIKSKLEELKPIILEIKDNVATIKTEIGLIKTKVEDIQPKVTDIKDRVVNIQTLVGDIKGTVESIKGDVVYIKTNEGWDVRLKLAEILQAIPPPAPDVSMGVNIATVLSAVAAIAAIVAAAVVVKRLKVAA
ncbi:MAG: hypothetical protein QXH20_00040 [Candidatus Bathyarchaeia archaeon]